MKTLSAALLAEHSATVTRPRHLVRINFAVPLRLCDVGDVGWDGETWLAASLRVDGLGSDGAGRGQARLSIGNADGVIGALILNERIADRPIAIWSAWVDAAGDAQVMPSLVGVGSGFSLSETRADIDVALSSAGRSHAPREMITPALGFTRLAPPGKRFHWNGTDYELERG